MATADPVVVNAMGMRCPWPALRAARAMREADAIEIDADDPTAERELEALAAQHGWRFRVISGHRFAIDRADF